MLQMRKVRNRARRNKSKNRDFRRRKEIMVNWCNYYNCWCNDLEMVVDEIECDEDCSECEYLEEINYRNDSWY